MALSKRLRYEILRRDNHSCRYCGATAPDVKLTVDHVVPLALGGPDEPENLVTACADCNAGKTSSNPDQPLIDDVSADAMRWSKALVQAAGALLADRERREATRAPFVEAWRNWSYKDWRTGGRVCIDLPGGWEKSVDSILAAGLPIEILCECVDIAMGRKGIDDEFRYMCGIAWNKVSELRAVASTLLAAEAQQSLSCGHIQPPGPCTLCAAGVPPRGAVEPEQ